MSKLLRARFKANENDPRPVNFPVKYPYWITGYGEGYSIIVSYANSENYILENWPEASELDVQEVEQITFSDRFPKPDWYSSEASQ